MTAPEPEGQRPRTCWRGECRTGCFYPDVCSEAPAPPVASEGGDDREALAEVAPGQDGEES